MTRAILPFTDGVGDIGSAARLWKTIYITRLTFADGTYMESANTSQGGTISKSFDTGWIQSQATAYSGEAATLYSGAHLLGAEPKFCNVRFKRILNGVVHSSAYDNNDICWVGETAMSHRESDNDNSGWAIKFDSANYYIRASDEPYWLFQKTGIPYKMTPADYQFKVVFYA